MAKGSELSFTYSLKAILLEAGVSKQGHAQALKREVALEQRLECYIGLIQEIRDIHPAMGLRKMYNQFEPEGIGRDAFIALGLQAGFRLKAISNPRRTTYSIKSNRFVNLLKDRQFTDVNQIWTSDITYYWLEVLQNPKESRFYYIVLIMDVYSRRIIGYSVADNMKAYNNVNALKMALNLRAVEDYQKQLIHHSDRGSQYLSNDYTEILQAYGIRISMCSDVLENAHIERVNGIIKNDYLRHWKIASYTQLKRATQKAVKAYNHRLHHSIGKTPIAFENHINNIPIEKREKLKIFTYQVNKQISENSSQLRFDF